MFISLSSLLHVLVASVASAASIPFVAAQTAETELTTDQMYGTLVSTAAPAPGYNVEGGSVFQNYVDAVNNGQLLFLWTGSWVYEKPDSETVPLTFLNWCSDLTFSDFNNSSLIGYAARCVGMFLAGYTEAQAAGAQLTFDYSEVQFAFTLAYLPSLWSS